MSDEACPRALQTETVVSKTLHPAGGAVGVCTVTGEVPKVAMEVLVVLVVETGLCVPREPAINPAPDNVSV